MPEARIVAAGHGQLADQERVVQDVVGSHVDDGVKPVAIDLRLAGTGALEHGPVRQIEAAGVIPADGNLEFITSPAERDRVTRPMRVGGLERLAQRAVVRLASVRGRIVEPGGLEGVAESRTDKEERRR
jgi:hypothetical protein